MLYLGNHEEERVQLKPSRLTTHGVIVGMTGSGKTGLGLVLLEELAQKGVPIIAIDPKGDLANLGLLFPDYDKESFGKWVEDPLEAEQTAARWKSGVGKAGLSDVVHGLKEKLDLRVYTPGSTSGDPVDLLGAFRRPKPEILGDDEARVALVQSTVSGLLGLAGRTPDPLRDPAHIVLSKIVDDAWSNGQDPDLETLILALMDPPFEKVGVFPLDKFFPPDDRTDIAMALNAVIAAPSFAAWQRGAALDCEAMLARGDKTRVSIFHIAHLDEVQRAFFISLLLGQLLAHTRNMPGTDDLRAVLYFDEVAGYLPPHPKNPPTKGPLLTMMKQARAVGVSVVLATQNPVDLDYKALSNAGVWAIGRLQTQQDRDRVLKGMGRTDLDDTVEALRKREFVLFDAKSDGPQVMKTRHAMCFLRGPFTRVELAAFKRDDEAPPVAHDQEPAAPKTKPEDGLLSAPPKTGLFLDERVVFSRAVGDRFSLYTEPMRDDGATVYRPAMFAEASLRFDEDRVGFVADRRVRRAWFPLDDGPSDGEELPLPPSAFMETPLDGARFHALPNWCDEEGELKKIQKRFVDDLYRNETTGRFVHKKLRMNGRGDEDEGAFRERVRVAAIEYIDEKKQDLFEKTEKKLKRLQQKEARAEGKVADLRGALRARQADEIADIGATIFGMFTGSRRFTGSKVSRAVKKRSKSSRTGQRVARAEEELADVRQDMLELQHDVEADMADLDREVENMVDDIEEREVRLEKSDIRVEQFTLLYIPVSRRA